MTNNHNDPPPCRCCMSPTCASSAVSRREFLAAGAVTASGLALLSSSAAASSRVKEPDHMSIDLPPLKVQPVLAYNLYSKRDMTSWRPWGGLHSEKDIAEEKDRITKELNKMAESAEFGVNILPLIPVTNAEQAAKVAKGNHDVLLMYAANSGLNVLEALTHPDKWTIMFVRMKSGPVYLWYEIAHNRYLRKTVDEYGQPGMDYQDVVVDDYDEILWRLRALYGLKQTLGKRIVALGGPGGWGHGGRKAPDLTRKIFKMDLHTVEYDDLGERIKLARKNDALVKWCYDQADKYIKQRGVSLETDRSFVRNAFVLNEVFKDLMDEAKTDAFTIQHCMGTVMPISETTACLPLTLLNDEGYTAYCESDFVVIPSGILLHYISGKPVFLNDPTYPHQGVVTLAHCTAPRKMDGEHYEKTRILTHFESDYGAAPKVDMSKGEKITVIDPDFNFQTWLGFEAEIIDHPFYDICRSQIDVQINGDCDTLCRETKGFHWMAAYGDYLKETGYALKKVGIEWNNLTKKA